MRDVNERRHLELLRRRPALVIRLPLEENVGVMYVDADTAEDERRLRRWLRHANAFRAIRLQLNRFLDDLDTDDREREVA